MQPKMIQFVMISVIIARTAVASSISWGNCSDSDPPGLQCGQLEVPIDWNDPKCNNITLGIARFRSPSQSDRIGSVFFNPGGPGGAASEIVSLQSEGLPIFSNALVQSFDIIGMDPRGVGLSTPIVCDENIWAERVTYFPQTREEYDAMVAHNKRFGESCLELTGDLLGFMDTISVAKDMEAVRVALGEDLNYLGLSYGTQLGSQYAQLFPDHIRTLVLDGNVDHSASETDMLIVESYTGEDSFLRFAQWCEEDTACALNGQNVTEVFASLVSQANTTPIPAPGCEESLACRPNVTGEDILFALQGNLIFKSPRADVVAAIGGWSNYSTGLAEALAGDATSISPEIPNGNLSNVLFAGLAVECQDTTTVSADTFEKLQYKQQLIKVIAPHTGATQTYSEHTQCLGWPVPVTNPMELLNITTTNTILLVQSTHDPECSIVWADALLQQINNGVLLTRDGDGHTSYFLGGETTAAIDAYLINGTLPAAGTILQT